MTAALAQLEWASSRLTARARLLERALHDHGPWALTAGFSAAQLRRDILAAEGRVVFTAHISGHGLIEGLAGIWCGDVLVAVLDLPVGTRAPCRVVTEIILAELAAA